MTERVTSLFFVSSLFLISTLSAGATFFFRALFFVKVPLSDRVLFVRARLQPCHTCCNFNAALAAEGSHL